MDAARWAWKSTHNICQPFKWRPVAMPTTFVTTPATRTRRCAIWTSNDACTRTATHMKNQQWAIWWWRAARRQPKCSPPAPWRLDADHIWIRRSVLVIARMTTTPMPTVTVGIVSGRANTMQIQIIRQRETRNRSRQTMVGRARMIYSFCWDLANGPETTTLVYPSWSGFR